MNLQKEQLKITISLGLITFFTALIFGLIQIKIKNNSFINLIKYVVYGFYTISLASLFLFVVLTGAKLKSRNPGTIDKTLSVGERFRNFLYDEGIEMTFRGITLGFFFYLFHKLVEIFNLSNVTLKLFLVFLIILILYIITDYAFLRIMKD